MSERRLPAYGNGDHCPTDPRHGRMYILQSIGKPASQFCPHSSHTGRSKHHPDGAAGPTRSLWPLGPDSFDAAVKEAGL